ncbi:sce7726 family protein [Leuconostoc mesenteroides]|uniref:sce7726 family protein n=1 Tax=Leuconostoc TaxID=1243 RepID=UPI001CC19591|nr:sce7726 family protein [Leuconostoc mesenteroides]MBZ1527940.1 sce7726 family protein [Leuconostoc mesenteroides]
MILNDKNIRSALVKKYSSNIDTEIWPEYMMQFDNKFGLVRADLVVINGHLTGFEIKSDLDSVHRLPKQILGYDRLFDYNYLVVGQKLYDKAVDLLPQHWGIIVATHYKNGNVKLYTERSAKINPNDTFKYYFNRISAPDFKKDVLPLLTSKEELKVLKTWPKSAVIEKYYNSIEFTKRNLIKKIVRNSIKKRVRSFN